MTFLQPALLLALPLAALPIIIHLVHLYRRRRVKWAAMMFLQMAQRMNKGFSRLRQIIILALRVLALAAIIFVITRPLAGGWLGLLGGAPDTVIILVDRSASMSQKNTATGVSKLTAGLRNLAKAINDAVGSRSHLVLIDSALGKPVLLDKAADLENVPQTSATDTAADIPGLLQHALDYITANKTGRSDIWILSDLQQGDWDPSDGRWTALRGAFATMQGVRFRLLSYPETAPDDIAIAVDNVTRRESGGKADLLLDMRITRHAKDAQPVEIPLKFVINGAATTAKVQLHENQLSMQGYAIPVDPGQKHGWGRVELPADSNPANDTSHFVFDEPPPLHSVVVSDNLEVSGPITAALSAAADPSHTYSATVVSSSRAMEIPWEQTALVVWQADIPKPDDAITRTLHDFINSGRTVLFLPPDNPGENKFLGLGWDRWVRGDAKPLTVEWWRNDDDLLANTRDGAALPVGTLEISRACGISGEGIALARLAGHGPLLERVSDRSANAYFLGTLPGSSASSLARDGVTMFALLHRALNEGGATLGKAQRRYAAADALGPDPTKWHSVEQDAPATSIPGEMPLHAGVYTSGDRFIALNRPPGEDQPQTVSPSSVDELFAGLDIHLVSDSLESSHSVTSEIWRSFLIFLALALIVEALLCLPPPPPPPKESITGFARAPENAPEVAAVK